MPKPQRLQQLSTLSSPLSFKMLFFFPFSFLPSAFMPFSPFSVRPALPCFPGASVSAVTLTGSRIFKKIHVIWLAQFHHLLWEPVYVQTIVAMSPRQNFFWETLWERKIIIILRGRFFLKQKKPKTKQKNTSQAMYVRTKQIYTPILFVLSIFSPSFVLRTIH